LVPNIMGTTVGVHPLFVIFALLAGAEVGGILGMLAVLPLLAMLKHTLDIYHLDLSRAPWIGDDGVVSMPVDVSGTPSQTADHAAAAAQEAA
jgi:predicted PurR-regulated permease PerM